MDKAFNQCERLNLAPDSPTCPKKGNIERPSKRVGFMTDLTGEWPMELSQKQVETCVIEQVGEDKDQWNTEIIENSSDKLTINEQKNWDEVLIYKVKEYEKLIEMEISRIPQNTQELGGNKVYLTEDHKIK